MSERRLTPRGQERRAQLIAVATTLFATRGYHPTSVADIVDELGVGKGVFYWYFKSKEELFVEILRTAQKDLRRTQQRQIAADSDPVKRIAGGVRAAVEWSAEHRDLFQLFEFAHTDEHFAPAMRAGRAVLVHDAATHIIAAMEAGQIPTADADRLAHAILGVTSQLTMEFVLHGTDDASAVAETVVTFCLGGIGAS